MLVKRFPVNTSTITGHLKLRRESGSIGARPHGGGFAPVGEEELAISVLALSGMIEEVLQNLSRPWPADLPERLTLLFLRGYLRPRATALLQTSKSWRASCPPIPSWSRSELESLSSVGFKVSLKVKC